MKQRKIHLRIRKSEQHKKAVKRHKGFRERKILYSIHKCHTRKWWKAWRKTWDYNFAKYNELYCYKQIKNLMKEHNNE